jgi:hypothetical protein
METKARILESRPQLCVHKRSHRLQGRRSMASSSLWYLLSGFCWLSFFLPTARHTLSCQSSSSNTVCNFFQSRIHVKHFCWGCLFLWLEESLHFGHRRSFGSYLRVLATLEEGSNTNEPNIVIPHHTILLIISRYFEGILKNYDQKLAKIIDTAPIKGRVPSKLSRPVLSRKLFFSLLYGM